MTINHNGDRTMTRIVHPDFSLGPDVCQGDLCLTRLDSIAPEIVAALDRSQVIRPAANGTVRLLEGEITGHHHEIALPGFRARAAMLRDDGMAAEIAATSPVAIGTAVLFADRKAADALAGEIGSPDRPQRWIGLHVGFLAVEGGPVDLIHPEHDTIRLPVGVYSVGRQVESAGSEERAVRD